jgi:putative heme-binding domain-containing protein
MVQRAAAEALGQHPDPANLRPLLDLWHATPASDNQLIHTTRIALRNQLRPAAAWSQLPPIRDERDARALADVAPGVHSTEAASFLLDHLKTYSPSTSDLERFANHIARYGTPDHRVQLLPILRQYQPQNLPVQAALLRAYQRGVQARGETLEPQANDWAVQLAQTYLQSSKDDEIRDGIALAGAFQLRQLLPDLTNRAQNRADLSPRRLEAMSAAATIDLPAALPWLAASLLDAAEPPPVRERCAELLGNFDLPEARTPLLSALATAPSSLQKRIAVALAARKDGAEDLLRAVTQGKASPRLLQDSAVQIRMTHAQVPNLDQRLNALLEGLPSAQDDLAALLEKRRERFQSTARDPELGAKLFTTHCAGCHQIAGQGARVGPQLDGVGERGLERLLEDILDPNRNVDQAFRATSLALNDGRILTGLLLREEGDVYVLADAQGKETQVPRAQVEEKTATPLSPMPANFAESLPEADLASLLEFLLANRAKPAASSPSTTP